MTVCSQCTWTSTLLGPYYQMSWHEVLGLQNLSSVLLSSAMTGANWASWPHAEAVLTVVEVRLFVLPSQSHYLHISSRQSPHAHQLCMQSTPLYNLLSAKQSHCQNIPLPYIWSISFKPYLRCCCVQILSQLLDDLESPTAHSAFHRAFVSDSDLNSDLLAW